MQEVSKNWVNAHKQSLLNESFVEVSLGVADPDALANASLLDNGSVYISDAPEIELVSEDDKNITPYCTLEQNLWVLDDSLKAIPESDYGECGYVGDVLSDDTCIFSTKIPVITIDFTEVFVKPIPGVTITWSSAFGEFADNFIVLVYSGENLVAQKEVTGNRSVTTSVWFNIPIYDRIEIVVKKWCLPHHRVRVEEIFVGLTMVYSKGELFDYSHSQSVDPLSTSLPKAEIRFSIDNTSGAYDPFNENGISGYLMERQEVKTRYGLKQDDGTIEWINGGVFYLYEWNAKQNGMTADFTARDLLEFMSATYTETHDLSERGLKDIAETLLRKANLPLNVDGTEKWVIPDDLNNVKTNAPLPEDSIANCLQLVANAGMCVMYQDREGKLHIEPWDSAPTDYQISSFNSYSKPELTLSKPIKQVSVKVYQYTMGEKGIDYTTSEETIVGNNIRGESITIDNPLIVNSSRAGQMAQRVMNQLAERMTLDFSWRADVRLDALDIVESKNDNRTHYILMTDIDFKYNGAFSGTGKGKVM